jgi:mono/diheme cytochrome c family protein
MTDRVEDPRRWNRPAVVTAAALVVSLVVIWFLGRTPSETDQARRRFADLQQQVAVARESRQTRQSDRGRVMRLRAQARAAAGAARDAFEAEAVAVEARLGWGDRAAVRSAVLSQPLIRLMPAGGGVARGSGETGTILSGRRGGGNGCQGCHLTVDTPGYEAYPTPFRTHPKLSFYVGPSSPHPPSRVRCESCHQGDATASTFAAAGHARLGVEDGPEGGRVWRDPAVDGAMLPVGRIEAGCVTCHVGERYQPGAASLNEALITLDRGGCYACHDVAGMSGMPRRGPDLRRISAKLTPEWVRAWLADPRAIKPTTWMPRFWNGGTASVDDRAAIDAVTAYLFEQSGAYTPAVVTPPRGDASRGRALVESVGCLGCHVVGAASRNDVSLRRTFGQPLDGVGSKTGRAWLFDWVRDPARFSPSTRMPNLRLDAPQAADVATYLGTLTGAVPAIPEQAADDDLFRRVIARYADADRQEPDAAALSGAALRVAAGRRVIAALGCFNCHEIGGFEGRRRSSALPAQAVWTDEEARAIHGRSAARASGSDVPRLPDFAFGATESSRLALALSAVAGRSRDLHELSMPWHVAKVAGRTLAQERNCVGCHQIDGTGGDLVQLAAEPSLGPPLLTPEGARVQGDWLHGFLRRPSTIRPWLTVRMPTFGLSDDDIATIRRYLVEIAPPNPRSRPPQAGATAAAGRELFELLKCQQCHVLGSIPADQPTANLAPDLRIAHERLQPEWIDAWLKDPSAILPGTRMPTYWPSYPQSFYGQIGGDAAAQIGAIREHLLSLR